MSEFIRLPNRIVNLSAIACVDFEDAFAILHTVSGFRIKIRGDDAAELFRQLEERYGLMTAPAARLKSDPIPAWLE